MHIYPPTPSLAMAGAAPGTIFGVDLAFSNFSKPFFQRLWADPNPSQRHSKRPTGCNWLRLTGSRQLFYTAPKLPHAPLAGTKSRKTLPAPLPHHVRQGKQKEFACGKTYALWRCCRGIWQDWAHGPGNG